MLLLPIILGAAAAFSFVGLLATEDAPPEVRPGPAVQGSVFTYYDIEAVSDELAARDLTLSTPVPITDHTIPQYCSYYDGASGKLETVAYCTTSGITDRNGITVGNVNMGGSTESPTAAIAVLDPVPPFHSGRGHADAVLVSVIEGLVCDCWAEEEPGGFESVQSWMNAAEIMLADNPDQSSLRSVVSGLAGADIVLEATTVPGGYQWTLIILQQ